MSEERRPYLSSFKDRHGTTRWRFRRFGKTKSLRGQPGEVEFDEAYLAAIEGRSPRQAVVIKMPGAVVAGSFAAAWRKVTTSAEWKGYDPATRSKNSKLAEEFLSSRLVSDNPVLCRDQQVRDLRRRHIKQVLASYAATPHKAKHLLVAIRKMIYVALDEEWIELDPSYKIKWRPEYMGWKAWPADVIASYEARWPVGSTPRLCFALALWLGNRRSDVATLRWDQQCQRTIVIGDISRVVDGFLIYQAKGGKELFVPITSMLAETLDATERRGATVLITQYGSAFSPKSLAGLMADWTASAGVAKGYTLHGLRKTLGKLLAEGGASTRQLMKTLGHDDIQHAELYSREAEQVLLATEGMDRVVSLMGRREATG